MSQSLHPEVRELLSTLRARRGFNAEKYVLAKTRLLNDYMRQSGLKSVVVGVSGGLDSALVLALLTKAAKEPNSPIENVVAALLPYFITEGTTNQQEATQRGREVAEFYGAECALVDLSSSHVAMKKAADGAFAMTGDAWASGQLVSYLRTPALFYLTSLETQRGRPSLLIGTTNRDEGGFIGYFGKAADAMVDLQLISDVHKSEIVAASRMLGVPQSVLDAAPTGDIYDGRNDEQLIGASYDYIELHSLLLSSGDQAEQHRLTASLSSEAREQFDHFSSRLNTLNRQNAHKYLGGSPAVHLDVYERAVPGGWRAETVQSVQAVNNSTFVNQFEIAPEVIERIDDVPSPAVTKTTRVSLDGFEESAFKFRNLASAEECAALRSELEKQEWIPVGRDGMLKNFDPATDIVGSYRATYYSEDFARRLWNRMAPSFPTLRLMEEFTPADWDGDPTWRAVGVSPLMRFIRYTQHGLLVPHYDAPYIHSEGKRTLASAVLYLTQSGPDDGGATRFIVDPQRHLPLAERVYKDWTEVARPRDVLLPVAPELGSALVFDHRILHDSEMIRGTAAKIIMRTDIIFERCGLPGRRKLTVSKPLGLPEPVAHDSKNASEATAIDLTSAHAQAAPIAKLTAEKRANMHAKVLRDKFYAGTYAKLGSLELVEDAGFFDDGTESANPASQNEVDWLQTPVDKIAKNLTEVEKSPAKPGEYLTVLLTTGSFDPVHEGHIEMMEIAKRELESRGAIVLGGYLCPSHDSYVSTKRPDALPGAHRLRLCETSVRDSSWLMADAFGVHGADRDLNFTDVISRLERYLSQHVRSHRPIQVVYVFGGDCARFTRAFLTRGRCVCVPRPGSEAALAKYVSDPLVKANSHIVFAREVCYDMASSVVRQGHDEMMRDGARESYQQWKTSAGKQDQRLHDATYHLRDEGGWALKPWLNREHWMVEAAWRVFRGDLVALLQRVHREAAHPDTKFDVKFIVSDLEQQIASAALLTAGEKVISLDPCIAGDFDLAVSRHFALSAGQDKAKLGRRPGHPSIAEQVASIPDGDYVLFDDDIATGTTMRGVQSAMPDRIRITRQAALTHFVQLESEALDILDSRDFLAGSRAGGLVVRMVDGSLGRAPYVLPYVSPSDRICTPLTSEVSFSRELWEINERFFSSITPAIKLSETDSSFRHLMNYVGFDSSSEMTELCRWHVEQLKLAK